MYLNIAICDDNEMDSNHLQDSICSFCAKYNLPVIIDTFCCGEDFLDGQKQQSYEIIFMDIYMTGISGIDTIRTLNLSGNSQIIFTSTSREHAIEAFGLNATHYLLKPLTDIDVEEALNRCLQRLGSFPTKQLEIKTTRGTVPIPIDNIIYIEVLNKICSIHTEKNIFQTYMSLNTLFELLDDDAFMRAQRSFIVNMHYIEAFFFDHVVLKDGKEIILSRNNRPELKEQYQNFLFESARRGTI